MDRPTLPDISGASEPTLAPSPLPAAGEAHGAPHRIGSYLVQGKLGEGGMGVVYVAEQQSPRRTVALKVIRPALLTPKLLRRFEHEAEILGRLQHPNVAQIYEAGTFDAGSGPQPFFAMEMVRGAPLTAYANAHQLGKRQRLELLAKVCDAVQYAHQNGVIHRDLKPANILVDLSGQPKVLDFGVARLSEAECDLTASRDTSPGQLVGTLQYMAPEQACEDPAGVDTRADVYSLGVIAYELLSGMPPLRLRDRSITEVLRIIREVEPASLSTLQPGLRGDVATIVAKAMAKDRTRRYVSASDLAGDIRRYLTSQPIIARPASGLYAMRKFARRHRTLVTACAILLVCLTAGIIGTASQARRATAAERVAREELRGALLNQARASRWSSIPGRRFNALQALREAARIRPGDDLRDEAIAAAALTDLAPLPSLPHGVKDPAVIVFDPAMQHCFVGGRDGGDLDVFRTADGAHARRLATPGPPAWVTAFSADGKRLAVKYHRADNQFVSWLRVWDVDTGKPLMGAGELFGDLPFDFAPDGQTVAVGDHAGYIKLYEVASGRSTRHLPRGILASALRFSPDGRYLLTGGRGSKTIEVRNVSSGAVLLSASAGAGIRAVAWHPTGEMIAAASDDLLVHVWEFPSGRARSPFKGHTHVPVDVCFSSSGDLLASYGWDNHLRLWQTATGRQVVAVANTKMFGDEAIRFDPDDRRLAYAANGKRAGLYQLAAGDERLTVPTVIAGSPAFHNADVSPDNRWIAVATEQGVVIYDLGRRVEAARLKLGRQRIAAFEPAGKSLITWGVGGLRRWPFAGAAGAGPGTTLLGSPQLLGVPPSNDPQFGSFSSDGSKIAVAQSSPGQVYLYDLHADQLLFTADCPLAFDAAISPDGSTLAVTNHLTPNPTLLVWDVPAAAMIRSEPVPDRSQPAFLEDGASLAVASKEWRGLFRAPSWHANTTRTLTSDGGVVVHPVGNVLAFSAGEGLVQLVTAAGENVLATLPGGRPVCFSRDGTLLLTHDGDLHVWDLPRVRRQLVAIGLDLALPPLSLAATAPATRPLPADVEVQR